MISLWHVLENLASPGDPKDPEIIKRYVAGAGLHDLAAKVVTVWDNLPNARPSIEAHLRLLASACYTGQNGANARWDRKDGVAREQGSADKVIELYWGCLCLLAGMTVELDDPFTSSGGSNPDVIGTAKDGTRWAFAIKTLAEVPAPETAAKNLRANIEKACQQIDRADCDKGMVVINLKNVLDHPLLRASGDYPNWMAANRAIQAQIGQILTPFYDVEAPELEPIFSTKTKVAPVAALVAHTTVLVHAPTGRRTFTEMKTMLGMPFPTSEKPGIGTYGREAIALATDLNDLVQKIL